jgi:hypothetical protein
MKKVLKAHGTNGPTVGPAPVILGKRAKATDEGWEWSRGPAEVEISWSETGHGGRLDWSVWVSFFGQGCANNWQPTVELAAMWAESKLVRVHLATTMQLVKDSKP